MSRVTGFVCALIVGAGALVPTPARGQSSAPTSQPERAAEGDGPPFLRWGDRKTFVGLELTFLSYKDDTLHAAMGRERQMLPGRLVISLYGDYNAHVSYRAEINPLQHSIRPRPYVPHESDRRTYFFANEPDVAGGHGVASVPEGLYHVDDYKTLGVDPLQQIGGLRVGYVDLHGASKRIGAQIGRVIVPQGLGLDHVSWLSTKDLTHMQVIDAAADNGVVLYYRRPGVTVQAAAVGGNGSPFHDYGYYDFTYGEDKNSAMATAVRGEVQLRDGLLVGASAKHNYVNSRIEDSTTLHLSKRYDNAFTAFAKWKSSDYLTMYGEVARYKWGQRDSSADLMPGVRPSTPLFKDGYYLGVDVTSPPVRVLGRNTRLGVSYLRSELDRDDSLVAWAAANDLYGAELGKRERSSIYRVQGHVGAHVQVFWFLHDLSNPFPELSAIKPIAGPGSDGTVGHAKSGMGLLFRF